MRSVASAHCHCLAWVSNGCVTTSAPLPCAIASVASTLPESTTIVRATQAFTLSRHGARLRSSLNVSTTTVTGTRGLFMRLFDARTLEPRVQGDQCPGARPGDRSVAREERLPDRLDR